MAAGTCNWSLVLAADHRDFPRLQAFVEEACEKAGCAAGQRLRVQLVMEELFTNTVKYGQSGASPVSITLFMEFDGKGPMTVRYEDDAPRHDPFEQAGEDSHLSASVTKRRIGGLGIVLVRELGKDVRYEWSGGKNRVSFVVPLDPPPRQY